MGSSLRRLAAAAALVISGCATTTESSTATGDYLSGRFAARVNAVDQAANAFAAAHAGAPGQIKILKDAFFYRLASGEVDAAAGYARELLAVDGGQDPIARLTLAAQALKARRLREARAGLSGGLGAPFLDSIAYLTEVWIERDLRGASAALEKLRNPPNEAFAGFNLLHAGLIAEQAGRMDEARQAYEGAALAVADPIARRAYGAFLERAGEEAAAREYYAMLAQSPGAPRRMAAMAELRLDRGEASQDYARIGVPQGAAIAHYTFAAGLLETAAGQRVRAADAGFDLGEPRFNFPLAIAQIALYLDPDFDEARRLVGVVLNIYGEYERAAAVLAQIPPSSPHFEQAQIDIAGGQTARENTGAAIRTLRDAIGKSSDSMELKLALASTYSGAEDYARAADVLGALIAQLPEDPPEDAWRFFVSHGAALLELDRWEQAESALMRAVEIAPEEPTALNYLGYSWAERGVRLEEAFALIEKAVAAAPQSGAIIDSLGWAYYQLGDYKEAVGHLERAASLEPSDATITDHLGDVYWRLGRRVEARFQWRHALDLDPSEKLRSQIERKLEAGLEAAGAATDAP